MGFSQTFQLIDKTEVKSLAASKKADGWRYAQMLATRADDGIDLTYSYMKDGLLENYRVASLGSEDYVESVTEEFFNAFVFENEAHDLFGVHIQNMAIDFQGSFYDLAIKEPMTIISPEQKAAKEKAAKVAAAKAAKEKGESSQKDDMEAKLAGMDPEKAAKVKAAMEAKALKEKLAGMDPEKAAKVKAAMEAKAKREAAAKGGE